jgi:DNA-binding NtrC family response regulator
LGKIVRRRDSLVVVLNIGIDHAYLLRRRKILAGAGYQVFDATSVGEALTLASRSGAHLAIFGHLIPPADRMQIGSALRAANPAIRVVVMYDRSATKTEQADAVLQIDLPPEDLIHTVEYLLSGGHSPSFSSRNA